MKYCQECGKTIPKDSKYCNFCGHKQMVCETNEAIVTQDPPEFDTVKAVLDTHLQLHCPKCRSTKLQAILKDQETHGNAVFTALNQGLGFTGFGAKTTHHYEWLCQNCGIRFPRIEDIEKKVHDIATAIVLAKWMMILSLIATLVVIIINEMYCLYVTIPVSAIFLIIWMCAKSAIEGKKAELYTFRKRCFE